MLKKLLPFLAVAVALACFPAVALAQHTVTLAWTPSVVTPSTPPAPVLSYSILKGTTSGGESSFVTVPIASLPACPSGTPAGQLCYIDSAVVNGTTYFYQVVATNSAGTSGKSSEVTVTIPLPAPTPPQAPLGLTGTVN